MTLQKTIEAFHQYVEKLNHFEEAISLIHWDLQTGAPGAGVEQRANVLSTLSAQSFQLLVSGQMKAFLEELRTEPIKAILDVKTRRMVEEYSRSYDRCHRIPEDEYKAYIKLTAQSEHIWEAAKEQQDFARFKPYLEQIVEYNRRFIEYWGYEQHPYDALLDDYEPGMPVSKLDPLFKQMRDRLVPLAAEIAESPEQPSNSFLQQHFSVDKQREFSLLVLQEIGYDFKAGRLDKSAHPFATGLNPGDVRITTNYLENDFAFSLFSSIHEGGHGMYEQNISSELVGSGLATGASMAVHESQSRLWENLIGRSLAFWQYFYPKLQRHFPGQLEGISLQQFYHAINQVKPSLIRIEADEITYNLHIMIRYELEKAIFEGQLLVQDLPFAWNEKYKQCLGIEPQHDGEGVLQDVHWSGGGFGYFPSYSLGNLYGSQIISTALQALPDLFTDIQAGRFEPLKNWLCENIYQHGLLYTPNQLIQHVTGEALNAEYFLADMEHKYRSLYCLK